MRDKLIRKIGWSSLSSWSVDRPKLSHLLFLHWCIPIPGYHTSSDNSNIQQQPMAGYWQASKSLLGVSQPRRVKIITDGTYKWQFKYANTIPTILCTSNGLTCGYITGIRDKRIVTSHITWNLPQSIKISWLLPSILFANYSAILYPANNSQLMLVS